MNSIIYLIIAFVSVLVAFSGNYFLQKKLLTIQNKEKGIDFLIKIIKQLESLYIKYWNNELHCPNTSLRIKITQTQVMDIVDFLHKKYKFENQQIIKLGLQRLISKSTDGEFDSLTRQEANANKSINIVKQTNNVIFELLKNKI